MVLKKLDMCVCANLLQSRPTLCNPTDYSPLGSSVHGILQARMLIIFSPRGPPKPGVEPTSLISPELAGGFFTTSTTWEDLKKLDIHN